MFLIIFLGLMAKLASVSSDCDIGNYVKNFDYIKFSGSRPWFSRLHTPNALNKNLDCPVAIYAHPEGNISLITSFVYVISEERNVTIYGNATNWNRTGWDEIYQESPFMNGRAYVIAVDYDLYIIVKFCYFDTNQQSVFVAYRSETPSKETVESVLIELRKSNLNRRQMEKWPEIHCQLEASSAEIETMGQETESDLLRL